jgi:biopolymer transport protein ExbB
MGQSHAVTGGVAEALICTASGIFVAISILVPYNFFSPTLNYEQGQIDQWMPWAEKLLASNENPPPKQMD